MGWRLKINVSAIRTECFKRIVWLFSWFLSFPLVCKLCEITSCYLFFIWNSTVDFHNPNCCTLPWLLHNYFCFVPPFIIVNKIPTSFPSSQLARSSFTASKKSLYSFLWNVILIKSSQMAMYGLQIMNTVYPNTNIFLETNVADNTTFLFPKYLSRLLLIEFLRCEVQIILCMPSTSLADVWYGMTSLR